MGTIWFWLVAIMIAIYVLLDGFDLGAGAIHLLVAKTDEERRQVLASIGPVWDGNEVWLIAAGGTLYFAFPTLYASAFSGFYLPLMIVLWLLILRGASIEFRNHIKRSEEHTSELQSRFDLVCRLLLEKKKKKTKPKIQRKKKNHIKTKHITVNHPPHN